MRWSHLVLLFQALITLTIGMIFLAQVVSLDLQRVVEYRIEVTSESYTDGSTQEYMDLKTRYASASYILLFVSICELIILLKLVIK